MLGNYEEVYAFATHMRAEHRRLHECVEQIEQQWREQKAGPADFAPRLASSLESLGGELARHFEEEENGGCLEEAVSRQPSLSQETRRLEHEHGEMLGLVRGLVGRLRTLPRGDSIERIETDYHHFVETLQDHEAAEDRILAEGLGVPID